MLEGNRGIDEVVSGVSVEVVGEEVRRARRWKRRRTVRYLSDE